MTDAYSSAGSQEPAEDDGRPVIRDKRRIDPQTGQVRDSAAAEGDSAMSQHHPDPAPEGTEPDQPVEPQTPDQGDTPVPGGAPAQGEAPAQGDTDVRQEPGADERAAELQDQLLREKAAFHNYRELMKRERPKDRDAAISSVVEALLPVMDDIHLAREHGDLAEGTPFAKIADKLESTLRRFGVESIGAAGEAFDPTLHEALMHVQAELPEGSEGTTVVQVMQPGYKVGDRVVRAARVSVADPA